MATLGTDLLGEPLTVERKVWEPVLWQTKAYPLLGVKKHPDRSETGWHWQEPWQAWDRDDCLNWLGRAYPGRVVPRSACVCCPYRSNREWRQMRDDDPDTSARAVAFDHRIRDAYTRGQNARGYLAGKPYVHRTLVPLDVADLSERLPARKGCGGLFDEEPDGMCGV